MFSFTPMERAPINIRQKIGLNLWKRENLLILQGIKP
jgi:hypothetical protein